MRYDDGYLRVRLSRLYLFTKVSIKDRTRYRVILYTKGIPYTAYFANNANIYSQRSDGRTVRELFVRVETTIEMFGIENKTENRILVR